MPSGDPSPTESSRDQAVIAKTCQYFSAVFAPKGSEAAVRAYESLAKGTTGNHGEVADEAVGNNSISSKNLPFVATFTPMKIGGTAGAGMNFAGDSSISFFSGGGPGTSIVSGTSVKGGATPGKSISSSICSLYNNANGSSLSQNKNGALVAAATPSALVVQGETAVDGHRSHHFFPEKDKHGGGGGDSEPLIQYEVEGLLGKGTYGHVFKAKRISDGQSFALKILDVAGMKDRDKERSVNEVRCIIACDFFSVISCYADFTYFRNIPGAPWSGNSSNSSLSSRSIRGGPALPSAYDDDPHANSDRGTSPETPSKGSSFSPRNRIQAALQGSQMEQFPHPDDADNHVLSPTDAHSPNVQHYLATPVVAGQETQSATANMPRTAQDPNNQEEDEGGLYATTDPNAAQPRMMAMILDFADAGDLRGEIRLRHRTNSPFMEREAALMFLQIIMAVHHLHCLNMMHRDIKSANVLLCCNGLVKLADFGFSRMFANTSISDNVGKTYCGTPYYCAPEIWYRRVYNKKVDMFALGVLLYEMLSLDRPFPGETSKEVMSSVLRGEYAPLPTNLSPEIRTLVDQLLHPDPAHRPSTGQVLRSPLGRTLIDGFINIVRLQKSLGEETRSKILLDVQKLLSTLATRHSAVVSDLIRKLALKAGKAALAQKGAAVSPDGDGASVGTVVGSDPNNAIVIINLNPQNQFEGKATGSRSTADKPEEEFVLLKEGTILKYSKESRQWKARYLCLVASLSGTSADPIAARKLLSCKFIVGSNKEALRDQFISIDADKAEDAFGVPKSYAEGRKSNVFVVTLKDGSAKRLTFQAKDGDDLEAWLHVTRVMLRYDE